MRLSTLLVCLVLTFSSGCAGLLDNFLTPEPQETALELYESGRTALDEGDYEKAAERFQAVKDQYPFSPFAIPSELGLADAFYLDGKYAEAVDAYTEFENLHPSDENIPYVLYKIGKSNFDSFTSIDRPMGRIESALAAFNRVQDEYPDSQYAQPSAELARESRKLLAEHELFIANFYWNSGRYSAAWKRYGYVAQAFQEFPGVVSFAEKRSRLAYYEYTKLVADTERKAKHGGVFQWFKDWL